MLADAKKILAPASVFAYNGEDAAFTRWVGGFAMGGARQGNGGLRGMIARGTIPARGTTL